MGRLHRSTGCLMAVVLTIGGPAGLAAQSQTTPPTSTTTQSQPPQKPATAPAKPDPSQQDAMPVDIERIKNALKNIPALHLDDAQLRFYAQVYAKAPTFEDFVGDFDLKNGLVPRAGMTHQEFLNMVTPKELYSSAGITATEMLQFALTNWAAQQIIRKGLRDLRDARNEREIQTIRDRINRELAALGGK